MSRDYKTGARKPSPRRKGGSLFAGIVVGLLLGLAAAVGVAWYWYKTPSPFVVRDGKTEKTQPAAVPQEKTETRAEQQGKPRFDFYKILPGVEEPAPAKEIKPAKAAPPQGKDSYFLQAGAFQNFADADKLKARLALLGFEAAIQPAEVPGKGTLQRVRLGPYAGAEELDRTRAALKQDGIETSVVKAHEAAP